MIINDNKQKNMNMNKNSLKLDAKISFAFFDDKKIQDKLSPVLKKNQDNKEKEKELNLEKNSNNNAELSGEQVDNKLRNLQSQIDVFSNGLLGELKDNVYKLSEPVVKELLSLKKNIEKSEDGIIDAISRKSSDPFFILRFQVYFSTSREGLKVATLKVVEKVVNELGVSKSLLTFVAKYSDVNDVYFMAKIKTVFNLIDLEDDKSLSYNDSAAPNISEILQKLAILKKKYSGIEGMDKKYFELRMLAIQKSGLYGDYIVRQLAILMKEYGSKLPSKNDPRFFKCMNALLDVCFQKAGKSPDKNIQAIFEKINNARMQDLDKTLATILNAPQIKKDKEQQQKGGKSSGGKSGGGGGKSGGDGGKGGGGKSGGGKTGSGGGLKPSTVKPKPLPKISNPVVSSKQPKSEKVNYLRFDDVNDRNVLIENNIDKSGIVAKIENTVDLEKFTSTDYADILNYDTQNIKSTDCIPSIRTYEHFKDFIDIDNDSTPGSIDNDYTTGSIDFRNNNKHLKFTLKDVFNVPDKVEIPQEMPITHKTNKQSSQEKLLSI